MKLSGEDVVLSTLVKHSFVAILLAVVIEELGLPSPIPTDVMIVFAGTTAGGSVPLLALYFVALTLAPRSGVAGYTPSCVAVDGHWSTALAATYTWDRNN
jgi:hypothetical protein